MSDQTTTKQAQAPETFEYQAEMKQLLHLIIHSLYTHEEIFLRELISNASDALNKIRFRLLTDRDVVDADVDRRIDIKLDKNENTLSISDSGIGMTKNDLIERIGTVASSGTLEFVNELKKQDGPVDAQLIGKFGVGFYSAFMVADEITIDTRHADPDSTALRWHSDGGGSYTIEETDRSERGTTITLHLKEDKTDFAEEWRVKQIVQRYSNFVDFPIYIDGEKVNTVEALWHKPKGEIDEADLGEFYKFISGDTEDPLGHLHLEIEGVVAFKALVFIPGNAPRDLFREDAEHGLHLYSSKVFIRDDCDDLLPDYLRFVKGVVDTEDLPLNVSREQTQSSPVMAKIRKILTGKILGLLEEWAMDDEELFSAFFAEFGPLFKTGLTSDFTNRDELMELVRYESSAKDSGELVSLASYVDRMQSGQDKIYYVMADSRTLAERNPNMEYFRDREIEVLYMIDPVDVFVMPSIPKYKDYELVSVEKADLKLDKDSRKKSERLKKHDAKKLVQRFKSVLGDRVEDVRESDRLVQSAVTLVTGSQGIDAQTERMMRMMDENFEGTRKVLEINTGHPLIRNLAAMRDEPGREQIVESAIMQLYEGALLMEGVLKEPQDFVARMTDLMVKATGDEGVETDAGDASSEERSQRTEPSQGTDGT